MGTHDLSFRALVKERLISCLEPPKTDKETGHYYGNIKFCVFGIRSSSFIHLANKLGRGYKLNFYLFV